MSSQVNYVVAIPARYASTRLAGKPLASVAGQPMIAQVCHKALQSSAQEVIACVDHPAVVEALEPLAQENPRLKICMTSDKPRSGTERIAEMITTSGMDPQTVVVNVQGDEPLITKDHIDAVASLLINSGADMSTLCAPITLPQDVLDPNCVKVVLNAKNFALYFSRAPIPYERDNFSKWQQEHAQAGEGNFSYPELTTTHYHHIGIYGYKAQTILDYLKLNPAPSEQAESLEQLRLLHYGMSIAVAITDRPPEAGVDTAADLERVNRILSAEQGK